MINNYKIMPFMKNSFFCKCETCPKHRDIDCEYSKSHIVCLTETLCPMGWQWMLSVNEIAEIQSSWKQISKNANENYL